MRFNPLLNRADDFFFNDTATTEIYTLSLHDALPISPRKAPSCETRRTRGTGARRPAPRSEEHTSELQSHEHLVCRLLLEKQKCCAQNRCCTLSPALPPSLPCSLSR